MSRTNREPEYRRRIRQKAEQDQQNADTKRQKAADNSKYYEIIRSIYAVFQEYQRHNNERRAREQGDRFWEIAGVAGLWLAAAVGIAAITVGTKDAIEQRRVMQGQLSITQNQFTATERPWISIDSANISS